MSKYKIGDKVKLKSGGPIMTVHNTSVSNPIQYRGNLRCQWFAGKKLEEGYFPEDSVEEAGDDDK